MSFHASYNPHLLAPPQHRHPSSSSHHNNKDPTRQNPAASTSSTSLHTGISAKLRNVLELQKYANFEVKVNIHEIANVPQLHGEFYCEWNFRGRHPKLRDGGPPHKPSLPNLKLTQARPQDSTTSLPVRSVSDDKPKLPHPSGSGLGSSQAMKGKSFSSPPHSLLNHLLPTGKHTNVEKKGSDPTPLRISLLGSDLQPVESPISAPDLNEDTPSSLASRSMGGRDSASSSLYNQTSTAASSTSYLSVPTPRHSTDGSEGTPTTTPTPEIQMERSNSKQTMSTSMSKSKSTPNPYSTHRSGTTPNRPLDKNHTCTWNQELYLTLRIPISKSEERKAEVGKNKPVLGEGPKSGSGLKLMIQQLPTPSATTTTQHKHSVDSEVHHSPAHSAAIHNASSNSNSNSHPNSNSNEKEKEEGEGGKHEKITNHHHHHHHHSKGKATPFGRVNIDLAAFAGRGRTTRKFLLTGSRTNATVQITVEMNYIGGDKDWVAPPIIEGHHVAARMKDIVGGRDASETLQKDLQLMKTPSASSTGSSISQGESNLSRNPSSNHPGPSRMYRQYKTYEHHLLSPEDVKSKTPTASTSGQGQPNGQDTSSPDDRRAETPGLSNEDGTEISISPSTPTSRNFWNHRSSRHHGGHRSLWKTSASPSVETGTGSKKTPGIPETDVMKIIESIFNPIPGRENSPFTYIPTSTPIQMPVERDQEELRGEAEHHELQSNDNEAVVGNGNGNGKRIGWRRRKTERKDTVCSVMAVGNRTVSSTTTSTTRNPSPTRGGGGGGRGNSPGRLPRVGSSTAIPT